VGRSSCPVQRFTSLLTGVCTAAVSAGRCHHLRVQPAHELSFVAPRPASQLEAAIRNMVSATTAAITAKVLGGPAVQPQRMTKHELAESSLLAGTRSGMAATAGSYHHVSGHVYALTNHAIPLVSRERSSSKHLPDISRQRLHADTGANQPRSILRFLLGIKLMPLFVTGRLLAFPPGRCEVSAHRQSVQRHRRRLAAESGYWPDLSWVAASRSRPAFDFVGAAIATARVCSRRNRLYQAFRESWGGWSGPSSCWSFSTTQTANRSPRPQTRWALQRLCPVAELRRRGRDRHHRPVEQEKHLRSTTISSANAAAAIQSHLASTSRAVQDLRAGPVCFVRWR